MTLWLLSMSLSPLFIKGEFIEVASCGGEEGEETTRKLAEKLIEAKSLVY